jgi:hypothetical protein
MKTGESPLALFRNFVRVGGMIEPSEVPHDLPACQAFIRTQAAALASRDKQIEELGIEMEKLRKLLSHFVNGHRSEKRILTGPDQSLLPFDNSEEFQAARAEAEAQAEAIVQTFTVTRVVKKNSRTCSRGAVGFPAVRPCSIS